MPTFLPAPSYVQNMARDLIAQYGDHQSLHDMKARVDLVFAAADRDENGAAINDAITKGGVKCLGLARKIGPKDRAMGRGDAEITLDSDWWDNAPEEEQLALLDHELHHLTVKKDKFGVYCTDDSHRPVIKLRPHDYEFGWFKAIAARHGNASPERMQAKTLMDEAGQFFWDDVLLDRALPTEELTRYCRGHQAPDGDAVQTAAAGMVKFAEQHGASVTISSDDKVVRFGGKPTA